MTKAGRPRRRYVLFQVTGPASTRDDLLRATLSRCTQAGLRSVKLIQFDQQRGIVRVSLEEMKRLREIFDATPEGAGLRALCTAGTLRSLRERFFPPGRTAA